VIGGNPYPFGFLGLHRKIVDGQIKTNRPMRKEYKVKRQIRESKYVLSHIPVKGPDEFLIDELHRFTNQQPVRDDHMKKALHAVEEYLNDKVGNRTRQLSYRSVLELKEKKSSPGEPWAAYYTTFGLLIKGVAKSESERLGRSVSDDEALDYMAEFVGQVDGAIRRGDLTQEDIQFTFYVHSKEDKYSPKKILISGFRSIQACDWVFQAICGRYGLDWTIEFKEIVPEVAVKASRDRWHDQVGQPLSDKFTYASDFTGFDRNISSYGAYRFVKYLCSVTNMPVAVGKLVYEVIARGFVVLPDGRVISRVGGNPSGQPFTAEFNNFMNLWMSLDVYSYTLSIEPSKEFFEKYVLRLCGDDIVFGGDYDTVKKISEGCESVYLERWHQPTKHEIWLDNGKESRVWPPGVHAPFLDCTSIPIFGRWIDVPIRPLRRITAIFFEPESGVTEREILSGVFESVLGWYIARENGQQYPSCLDQLFELCESAGCTRPLSHIEDSYGLEM